jgi:hypothetical protein
VTDAPVISRGGARTFVVTSVLLVGARAQKMNRAYAHERIE